MFRRVIASVFAVAILSAAARAQQEKKDFDSLKKSAHQRMEAQTKAAVAAFEQDKQDKESIKKRILEKVEAKLKQEEERILKEIEKVIDEELAKMEGRANPRRTEPREPADAKKSETRPGFLGVFLEEIDEQTRATRDLPEDAVLAVQKVIAKSPAESAGLKAGDVILSIGKAKVDSVETATKEIMKLGAGSKVSLTVLRGNEKISVDAKLGERPQDEEMQEEDHNEATDEADHAKSSDGLRNRIRKFMDGAKDAPSASKPADDLSKRIDDLLAKDEIQKGLTAAIDQLKKMNLKSDEYLAVKDGRVELTEKARAALKERLASLNPERLERRLSQISRWVEDFSSGEPGAIQDRIRKFIEDKPAATAAASKPLLGVRVKPIGDDVRAQFDLEEGVGLAIEEIAPGTAAEKAGLKAGDVILALDGKPLKGETELSKALRRHAAGDDVEVKILREGKEQVLKVKLGSE